MQTSKTDSQSTPPEDGDVQGMHHLVDTQYTHLHLQQDNIHADAEVTGL